MKYIGIGLDVYHISNKDFNELDKLEINGNDFYNKLKEIVDKYKKVHTLVEIFNY